MKLKKYSINHKKRKKRMQQEAQLLIGVDVSKTKYDACIGTLNNVKNRIKFSNARDGFKRFEYAMRKICFLIGF